MGIDHKLYALGYGSETHERASFLCRTFYGGDLPHPIDTMELEIVRMNFLIDFWLHNNTNKDIYPQDFNNTFCPHTKYPASCSMNNSFICQKTIPDFGLERPVWQEHVPVIQYAKAWPIDSRTAVNGLIMADYYEAKYICENLFGGILPEPSSQAEQDAIVTLFTKGPRGGAIWLGFNDLKELGKWVKESDGSELTYSNWVNNMVTLPMTESYTHYKWHPGTFGIGVHRCALMTLEQGSYFADTFWTANQCFGKGQGGEWRFTGNGVLCQRKGNLTIES